jgi:hypothetical protein
MDNNYPVYAISGPAGATLINDLSWYWKKIIACVPTFWAAERNDSEHSAVTHGARPTRDRKVQTISSNGMPDDGLVSGLLFVPTLEPHDPCLCKLESGPEAVG